MEDFERILSLDEMYIYEKEKEIEEEYYQWCEEEELSKLPAKIKLLSPFKININETKFKSSSF